MVGRIGWRPLRFESLSLFRPSTWHFAFFSSLFAQSPSSLSETASLCSSSLAAPPTVLRYEVVWYSSHCRFHQNASAFRSSVSVYCKTIGFRL
ncbi:hypothetical protein Ahy_A06g029804 isoform B [Arachis hypogaea]|uniref:Uncharacterized protein n=1 Tax=Arachis hypogaea TaxID=3818 RepID=A0A445CUB3_ARAHY|nr:hypothetical protein Ahy_A06g029804 isoform B [Arachis hypogaea]